MEVLVELAKGRVVHLGLQFFRRHVADDSSQQRLDVLAINLHAADRLHAALEVAAELRLDCLQVVLLIERTHDGPHVLRDHVPLRILHLRNRGCGSTTVLFSQLWT